MDNVKKLLVAEALDLRTRGDIRSVLAAAAIDAMTRRASGGENTAASGDIGSGGARLRRRRVRKR